MDQFNLYIYTDSCLTLENVLDCLIGLVQVIVVGTAQGPEQIYLVGKARCVEYKEQAKRQSKLKRKGKGLSKVQITSGNRRQKERRAGDRGGGGRSKQVFRCEV